MININLLPKEYRRRERTSFKVFGTFMLSVLLVCGGLGWFGHVFLNEFKAVEAQRMIREERLANLRDSAAYDDALREEKKEYETRSRTIQEIANSRVLWTKVLDQFFDIVNNQGNSERHNAWFRNLTINPGGRGGGGPVLSMNAYIASKSWTKQANFLDDIFNSKEFFQDMEGISDPGGNIERDESKSPPEAISFQLNLRMKKPEEWARNKKR